MIKYIDLFAGIGGFHLALEDKQTKCVWACDNDPASQMTYFNNFKIKPEGDITKVDLNKIPEFDILAAGFPCQSYSRAGKMLGFADPRGTMFFEIYKIAKIKKPKILFLENVANFATHDKGETLKASVGLLESLGYKVSWQILNSKDFGSAQSRERFILVASLDKKFDFSQIKRSKKEIKIKDILSESKKSDYLDKDLYTILPKHLWKQQKSGLVFCGYLNKAMRKNGVRKGTTHLSRVHKQPNRIYYYKGNHPTISAQETTGRYFIFDDHGVKKLTIDDCYKLQGFPKSFTRHPTLTKQYHQIGNSVPVMMIKAVADSIKEQLF